MKDKKATTKNTYTPKVGRGHASERLTILNECYNPFSLNHLKEIDLKGKTVLEVACGIGIFTCELAKLVGKEGKVVATDISHEQLEVAKEYAKQQNLSNIEFIECSAFELDKLDMEFDCVHSRFLLAHLENPISVLKQELNRLKPGGYLISVEPPFAYDTISCYPKSDVFDKIRKVHVAHTKVYNTDFRIGIKIPIILKELGCSVIYSYTAQAILDTPRKKSLLRLGMYEVAEHIIAKGFFSKNEIEHLSEELKQFEQDNYIVAHFSSMETCVRKSCE